MATLLGTSIGPGCPASVAYAPSRVKRVTGPAAPASARSIEPSVVAVLAALHREISVAIISRSWRGYSSWH